MAHFRRLGPIHENPDQTARMTFSAPTYSSIRNTNEGMNGFIKDSAYEALGDPLRRRIHGRAAQTI
jgi:hypothetical protein